MSKIKAIPEGTVKVISFDFADLHSETQKLLTDTLVNYGSDYAPAYLDNTPHNDSHLFGRGTLDDLLHQDAVISEYEGGPDVIADLKKIGQLMDEQEAAYFRIVK